MSTPAEIEKRLGQKADHLAWVDLLVVSELTTVAGAAQINKFTLDQFMDMALVAWDAASEHMSTMRPRYFEALARLEIKANMAKHRDAEETK